MDVEGRSDRAKKIAEEALTRLSDELQAGKSEALQNYLGAMSRFRRYSWNNVLLISSQRHNATHVAGIHAWNDLGRSVKKGQKGIAILAPVIRKGEPAAVSQAKQSSEPDAQEASRLTGFRTVYVFDVSQTEGKPLPEFAKTTGDPKDSTERLKAFAAKTGIAIEYDPSIAPALGVSSGGRIRLIPDLPKAEEFAVLAHEMAHEMLHHRKGEERPPKLVRETQAEAVAYVLSHAAGLETNHAAADYIALYNGDRKTLADSLHAIQETATRMLDELFPEPMRDASRTQETTQTETPQSALEHPIPSPQLPKPEETSAPSR